MKMFFGAVLVNAFHASFEDAEMAFNRICMGHAAHADQVIETLKSTGLNVTRMTGPAASDFGAF